MKRRDFVSGLGVGTAVLMTPALGGAAKNEPTSHEHQHEGKGHGALAGPLANAVVNFGQWRTDPPLDRFPNVVPTPPQNIHNVLPNETTIKAGGSISFIISGLHQILVYGPDVEPGDINAGSTISMTAPPGLALVNDANGRIYRGPDPSVLGTLDRVESVHFPNPGRYLVICGVVLHFTTGMFGYVKVLP